MIFNMKLQTPYYIKPISAGINDVTFLSLSNKLDKNHKNVINNKNQEKKTIKNRKMS